MAVPSRRKRGRPKKRWLDVAREDMVKVGEMEGGEVDWVKWRRMTCCGGPE